MANRSVVLQIVDSISSNSLTCLDIYFVTKWDTAGQERFRTMLVKMERILWDLTSAIIEHPVIIDAVT